MLLYGKFTTGFAAGGKIAVVEYEPETVKSWGNDLCPDRWADVQRDPGLPTSSSPTLIPSSPAGWIVNGRAASRDIAIGDGRFEVAAFAKNLLDQDRFTWTANTNVFAALTFERARSFGLEVTVEY